MQTVQKYFISFIIIFKVRKNTALLRCTANQVGTGHKLHFQPLCGPVQLLILLLPLVFILLPPRVIPPPFLHSSHLISTDLPSIPSSLLIPSPSTSLPSAPVAHPKNPPSGVCLTYWPLPPPYSLLPPLHPSPFRSRRPRSTLGAT